MKISTTIPENWMQFKPATRLLNISVSAARARICRKSFPVPVHWVGGRQYLDINEIETFKTAGGWDAFAENKILRRN